MALLKFKRSAVPAKIPSIADLALGELAINTYDGKVYTKKDDGTPAIVEVGGNASGITTITSTDGSVTITGSGATRDLSVAVAGSTTNVLALVRNNTGATLAKGTVVYINGSLGQNSTVAKAIATSDATSAQTLGLMTANLAYNATGYVTVIGVLTGMDTSAFTDGQQLYLSPTTAGTFTATKPYAPQHLVYVAVVEHAHPTQGKLFVKVQNGYEMDELHDVSAQNPANNDGLFYNTTSGLWEKKSVVTALGYTPANKAGDTFTGSVTIPELFVSDNTPTFTSSAFQYHLHQSPHIAYVKQTGGYNWYWRRNSTGTLSGTSEVEDMSLTEDGNLLVRSSVRAPIFYDTPNTAYFVDPSATSNLVGLTVANTITGSVSGTSGSISGFNNPVTAPTANTIVYRDSAGDISAREIVLSSGLSAQTPTVLVSMYPTTNQMVRTTPAAVSAAIQGAASGSWPISVTGSAATATDASKLPLTGGTLTGALTVPANSATTGGGINFAGAGSTFIRGTSGDGASSTVSNLQLQSWNGIGFGPSITGQTVPVGENAAWIDCRSGIFSARAEFRAPIFKDSDNTAYYIDPASTSRLANTLIGGNEALIYESTTNALGIRTGASAAYKYFNFDASGNFFASNGSVRTPIVYDSDNTAFYYDGAGTTNINLLAGNGKTALETADSYLRINQSSTFSNGIWLGSSHIGGSGTTLHLGSNGDSTLARIRLISGTYNGSTVITLNGADGVIYATKTGANNTPAIQIRGGNFGYPRLQVYGLDADANGWMGLGTDMGGGPYEHSVYFPNGTSGTAGNGRLTIGDYNGTTYNPRLYVFTTYTQINKSARSPLFYDSDNTAYYIDPASGFNFAHGNVTYVSSTSGLYVTNAESTGHTVRVGAAYGRAGIYVNPSLHLQAEGTIEFWTGNAQRGYFDASSNLFANASHRAPIFYDSNDTGYFINPNSESNLNITRTYIGARDANANWNTGFQNTPAYTKAYHGDISSGGPAGTWWFYESMRHSNASNYWGTQVAWGWEDNANRLQQRNVTGNSFSAWVEYLNTSGRTYSGNLTMTGSIISSASDVRAPIFYDQNDTSAYVDPAGASWIKGGFQMMNPSASNDCFGGLEMRENGLVAASQSSASYAPRVNFHWGSRAAASLYMDSGGSFVFGGQNDITNNRRAIFCSDLYATGNVTAYYSDDRLKTRIGNIENALDIVSSLNGFRYVDNKLAETFGYANNGTQLGVSAQEVQKHLPEIVRGAAFDVDHDDPDHGSKTGEHYLTVDYSRLVPLLIEAIKELRDEVEALKK